MTGSDGKEKAKNMKKWREKKAGTKATKAKKRNPKKKSN